jgi:hypothetical protein
MCLRLETSDRPPRRTRQIMRQRALLLSPCCPIRDGILRQQSWRKNDVNRVNQHRACMRWTPVPQGWFPTRRLPERTTRARRQAPMSCAAAAPSIRFGDHGTPRFRRRLLCPALGIGRARPSLRSIAPGDLQEVRCLPIRRPWSPPGHRAASGTPTGVHRRMTGDRPYAARGCHAAASGGHTGQEAHLGDHRPAVAGMIARTSLEHPVTGTTIPLTRPLACWPRRSHASSPARNAAPGSWRAFVLEASA